MADPVKPPRLVVAGRVLARNTGLNLLGQALPLAIAVVSIPFLVRSLGASRFGVLSLAWAVVGYFSLFDLGLGRAATRYVAEALGSGSEERIPSIVWTAVVTQALLGVVGWATLTCLTTIFVRQVFHIPQDLSEETRRSFLVLAFTIPTTLVTGSFRGVLEAAQRFDLVNAVRAPLGSANFLLPCFGVALGWDVPRIIGLLLVSSCAGLVAYYWMCVRVFPGLRANPRFHKAEFRRLVSFGGWVMISSVVGPILVYLDRFMVGSFLSIAAVGYYSAPYEIVTRLWIIPSSLVATLFPAFSALCAQRNAAKLGQLVSRSTKYLLLSLGPIIIVTMIFAREILQLWLGSTFAEISATALLILSIGVLLNSIAQIPYALIQALDRPDLTAKLHVAETPVHILLVWTLVSHLGIAGAALAWTARVGLDTVLLLWIASRVAQFPVNSFLAARIPRTVAVLGLLGLTAAIAARLLVGTWMRVSVVASFVLLAGIAFWRYALDDGDRSIMRSLLGSRRLGHSSEPQN